MNQKELKLLKKFAKEVNDFLGNDYFEYLIDKEEESILIDLPYEDGDIGTDIDSISIYFSEISSIQIHPSYNRVTTNTITQRVVKISSHYSFYSLLALRLLHKYTDDNITIRLIDNPLLIGIAAVKEGKYSQYDSPCSKHYAVEVIYPSLNERLSILEEEKLIKIFMFELAHFHQINLEFDSYNIVDRLKDLELDIRQSLDFKYNIPLKHYNMGMDLFIDANQPLSPDLKFLTYYKIFEFFAPVKSKIEAFESMKLKLSSSTAATPDAKYISSIFELAKNYDKSLRDNELIKTLINSAFDLVDIYNLLPEPVRIKLSQKEIKYSIKRESLEILIDKLGNLLYQTRNSIVHAKSNFTTKGIECELKDLPQLNIFMHKACYSIIIWYSSLPEYLKLNKHES